MRRALIALVAGVLALPACGGDSDGAGGFVIDDARIGQPTGPNAAMYFTVTSGEADRLIGAESDVAISIEVHETTMDADGTMGMQAIEGLDLEAGETLVLEPGGYHLMLIDAERMEVGDMVEVTVTWENAGDVTVEAEVVDPGETMGHEHGG